MEFAAASELIKHERHKTSRTSQSWKERSDYVLREDGGDRPTGVATLFNALTTILQQKAITQNETTQGIIKSF